MNASFKGFVITVRADILLAQLSALFLISLYNERLGAKAKYLFYVFYPLHLIILHLVNVYII